MELINEKNVYDLFGQHITALMRRVLGSSIGCVSGISNVHCGVNTLSCGHKWNKTFGWWKEIAKMYRNNTL